MNEFETANRLCWDDRAAIHLRDSTGFYRLAELRAGGSLLTPIEAGLLADAGGRRILHLQCHIGTDTLSMARLGANVTGIDFSPVAIAGARALAAELELAATFVEGNVLAARSLVEGDFDIVFASWGVLLWHPDAKAWMRAAASVLAPGGRLILVDGHPSFRLLREEGGRLWVASKWRWAADAPDVGDEETTYTGDPTPIGNRRDYSWEHPMSDIIMGAIEAGLAIRDLREHERLAWRAFPAMVPAEPGLYRLPDGMPAQALSFSLVAQQA